MSLEKFKEFKVELVGFNGDLLFIPESAVAENFDYFTQVTSVIASQAFNDPTMDPVYMADMLVGNHLSLAITSEGTAIGLLMSKVTQYGEEKVLGYARANLREAQGVGLSTKMLEQAIRYHQPTAFSSRSQNPAALYSSTRMWRANGANTIYPFDQYYSDSPRALQLLQSHIIEEVNYEVDPKTGIIKGFYEKRLGDYVIDTKHEGIMSIESWLANHSLNRDAGDSVVYMGFLK